MEMIKEQRPDNNEIRRILDDVINRVVARFKPRTIILAGSFGRDEATFTEKGGIINLLSDCEITMVGSKVASSKNVNTFTHEIYQQTGLEVTLHNSTILFILSKYRLPKIISTRLWKPSIVNYDLLYASKVVYGEDILGKLPDVKSDDIPLWEGIKLMLNRMAGALKYSPLLAENKDNVIYSLNKVILACQDTLLLSCRHYNHSYQTRNRIFNELFPKRFGELHCKLPKFLSLASLATDFKLNLTDDVSALPSITEYWFDTLEICDEVFRHIIKQDMSLSFKKYGDFYEKYFKHPHLKKQYYLGTLTLPLLGHLFSLKRLLKANPWKLSYLRFMLDFFNPWQHLVYAIVPLVYFGLTRGVKIDEQCIKKTEETVTMFRRLESVKSNPVEEWDYLRAIVYDLWISMYN